MKKIIQAKREDKDTRIGDKGINKITIKGKNVLDMKFIQYSLWLQRKEPDLLEMKAQHNEINIFSNEANFGSKGTNFRTKEAQFGSSETKFWSKETKIGSKEEHWNKIRIDKALWNDLRIHKGNLNSSNLINPINESEELRWSNNFVLLILLFEHYFSILSSNLSHLI